LPAVDRKRCNLCGLCVDACACHSVEMTEEGPVFRCECDCERSSIAVQDCALVCEEVCPTGAISCSFEIVMQDDCVEAGDDQADLEQSKDGRG
jgi:formate hydrogenlyase subunit 6/NADH:ubiquinone oxidoreductase subunit I